MATTNLDRVARIDLTPTLRSLRLAAARWAIARGRPLHPATLGVILAAHAEVARRRRRHLHLFTTSSVMRLLFTDLGRWCRLHDVALPNHPGETLLTYLDFLEAHDRLAPGSSPIAALRETVVELCGLDDDGRVPAGGAVAVVRDLRRRPADHPAVMPK